jgi:hypothetical protein
MPKLKGALKHEGCLGGIVLQLDHRAARGLHHDVEIPVGVPAWEIHEIGHVREVASIAPSSRFLLVAGDLAVWLAGSARP